MTRSTPAAAPVYVVISPVRDEEEHLHNTIRSMVQQTIRPAQWIIVNDGSSDDTAKIIDQAASEHPWIKPVHRADRGRREAGTGVVQAFYAGYNTLDVSNWQFIVKFDGDLEFQPNYFEGCFAEFQTDPKLGIAGGIVCHLEGETLVPEPNPAFHVRGATKIYRRSCWEGLGGLIEAPGWDTIDELKANMVGWSTRSLPHLKLQHHRFTGAAAGAWRNAVKNGLGSYITGYHPFFILLRSFNQLFHKPYLKGSVGLLYGYCSGSLRRVPRIKDTQLIRYVRQQQLRRMFRFATVWK